MALNVDYLFTFSRKLIRKNMAGGLSSTDFNFHWSDAQSAFQEDLLGRFQLRNNGKEGINTGLIENETILQKLSPFIENATLTITAGVANKPQGFLYRLAMRINGHNCVKINHNQISSVVNSVIDPPNVNADAYYFVEYDDSYTFLPNTVTTATLDYVFKCEDVLWAYILDANDRQIYDAANSIQPLWNDNVCREITKRMLKSLGVSFKDSDFATFGQSVITTGE